METAVAVENEAGEALLLKLDTLKLGQPETTLESWKGAMVIPGTRTMGAHQPPCLPWRSSWPCGTWGSVTASAAREPGLSARASLRSSS
jgi:hypothetical protein